jgi:hypothetical protein
VGQRCLFFVTTRAYACIDPAEIVLRRVVTFVAVEALVDHVLRMPRRKPNFSPAFRHHAGGTCGSLLFDRRNYCVGETSVEKAAQETEPRNEEYGYCGALHRPPT